MANKPTSGAPAVTDEVFMELVKRMTLDYNRATTDKDRRDSVKRNIQMMRDLGVNEALTKTFEEMSDLGPKSLDKSMELVSNLAEHQGKVRQDLDAQRSKLLMDITSGPERTKAGIASLVSGVATIARLFGANDFANMAQAKADEIMASIKVNVETQNIRSGSAEMQEALKTNLEMLRTSGPDAAAAAAEVARKAAENKGPDPHAAIEGTAAPVVSQTSGRQKLTWDQFRQNMTTFGLTKTELTGLETAFGTAAKMDGDKAVLEPNERAVFFTQQGFKGLNQDKQTRIKGYVELAAEGGPK